MCSINDKESSSAMVVGCGCEEREYGDAVCGWVLVGRDRSVVAVGVWKECNVRRFCVILVWFSCLSDARNSNECDAAI